MTESNENESINLVPQATSIEGALLLGTDAEGKTKNFKVSDIKGDYKGLAVASTNPGVPTLAQSYDAKPGVTYLNFKDELGVSITIPTIVDGKSVITAKLIFNGISWTADFVALDISLEAAALDGLKRDFLNGIRPVGNLFDKNSPDLITGRYIEGDGSFQINPGYAIALSRVKPNTKYTLGVGRFKVFYNEYFAVISVNTTVVDTFTTPNGCFYVRYDFNIGYLDTQQLVEGDTKTLNFEPIPAGLINTVEPFYNSVLATRNAKNFNSIKELADKLMPQANYYNRYNILVPDGDWIEIDWQGWGDYIRITGMSSATIIKIVGTDTNVAYVTGADYSYPAFANKQIATFGAGAKHIVFVTRNIYCENLVFDATSCKYPVHIDNPNFKKAIFINCRIKENDCNYPIGMGLWAGQSVTFKGGSIERSHWHLQRVGFFFHNTTAQEENCEATFENVKFVQCGYGFISENGSNRFDRINIIDCESDCVGEIIFSVSQDADLKTFWTNFISGVKIDNPQAIPYNITVNTTGTKVDLISDNKSFPGTVYDGNATRPLMLDNCITDYYCLANVPDVSTPIEKGDLVSPYGDADNNNALRVRKCTSLTNLLPPIGIALENSGAAGSFIKIVKLGKYCEVKVNGATSNTTGRKLTLDPATMFYFPAPMANYKDVDAIAHQTKVSTGVGLILVKTIL